MQPNVPVKPNAMLLEAFALDLLAPEVTCRGDYYHVDFGETISPWRHQVFHLIPSGMVCLCELGSDCPAIIYVQQYMISVQLDPANAGAIVTTSDLEIPKLARMHPDAYMLRFIPHLCPECGGAVKVDTHFNGRTLSGLPIAGWSCANGGARCFLRNKMRQSAAEILAKRQANPDPWLLPPHPPTGYPGLRLSQFGQPRVPVISDTILFFGAILPASISVIQTEETVVQ